MNSPADWKKAVPYIKPQLSDDGSPTVHLSHGDSPILRSLNPDLLVAYLVDSGDYFSYLQYRDLPADMPEEDLHSQAVANLDSLVDANLQVHAYGEVFGLVLDGSFEASLLLLDWLWDHSLSEHAPNGYVIAVPARDVLAFCDAGSSQGIAELKQLVDRVFPEGDHTISRHLYRRATRQWVRHDA